MSRYSCGLESCPHAPRTYLVADLDLVAAPRREQDLVTLLDAHGHNLAILVGRAGTRRNDVRLRKGRRGARRRQEQAGRRLGLRLEALHEHAVEQRNNGLDRADGRRSLVWSVACPAGVRRATYHNEEPTLEGLCDASAHAFCLPSFAVHFPSAEPRGSSAQFGALLCALRGRCHWPVVRPY